MKNFHHGGSMRRGVVDVVIKTDEPERVDEEGAGSSYVRTGQVMSDQSGHVRAYQVKSGQSYQFRSGRFKQGQVKSGRIVLVTF